MSVFTTTSRSICYHDAWKFGSADELAALLCNFMYSHSGVSSCGLEFQLPDIVKRVSPRILIIERDPVEVWESMNRIAPVPLKLLRDRLAMLAEWKNHHCVMWVPFHRLDDPRVMADIWFHLLPGLPFDAERFDEMSMMRIQVDNEKTIARYRADPRRLDWLKESQHA
jgi:hypothetical protein